jgi:hypothetical protein
MESPSVDVGVQLLPSFARVNALGPNKTTFIGRNHAGEAVVMESWLQS